MNVCIQFTNFVSAANVKDFTLENARYPRYFAQKWRRGLVRAAENGSG